MASASENFKNNFENQPHFCLFHSIPSIFTIIFCVEISFKIGSKIHPETPKINNESAYFKESIIPKISYNTLCGPLAFKLKYLRLQLLYESNFLLYVLDEQ